MATFLTCILNRIINRGQLQILSVCFPICLGDEHSVMNNTDDYLMINTTDDQDD